MFCIRGRGIVLSAAVLVAAAAGCGGDDDGPATLTVYVSAPLHGGRAGEGQAIVSGAKLALGQAGSRVGNLRIRAFYLDDTGGGPGWSPVATAANARRAAEDSRTIGYIGDVDSGATRVSLPITNQAEIAQISPAGTAVDLTREASGGVDPDRYRPSGEQTFARVVPADDVQARGAALLAKQLDAGSTAVVGEDSDYGRVLADGFRQAAGELGVTLRSPAQADVVYFAGASPDALLAFLQRSRSFKGALIASDALLESSLRICEAAPRAMYITSPFRAPHRLPPRANAFTRAYQARFGRPEPAAAYGYEAMSLLLDAIRRAGSSGDDRGAVIDEVLATSDRESIVGDYSIEGDGDTTLDWITVDAVRDCRRSFDRELRAPQ